MKLIFLGTGTSHGVPVIGCDCKVCKSSDERDKRNRCSVYVTSEKGTAILIDCGPEFRLQAVKNNIKKIDCVLLTHSHADHLHGLDDLRAFSCDLKERPSSQIGQMKYDAPPIPIYANAPAIQDVKNRFDYCFGPVKIGGGRAKVQLVEVQNQFSVQDITVTPIKMRHGILETLGWLLSEKKSDGSVSSVAYLTDCNFISDESINLIKENCGTLEHLVIDGLRIESHSTHFNILEAMETAEKIGGKNVWLTHLTHHSSHEEYTQYIQEHLQEFPELTKSVFPAYDNLVLNN